MPPADREPQGAPVIRNGQEPDCDYEHEHEHEHEHEEYTITSTKKVEKRINPMKWSFYGAVDN
jgi:hypothetical protein